VINIKEIMCDVFECDVDDIGDDAEINEVPGWDSLNHVRLILALNAEGLDIAPSQIAELSSYQALVKLVE